ncbi:MAG: hypothetical protein ACRDYA_12910 [Egibacteraceae bacterium]
MTADPGLLGEGRKPPVFFIDRKDSFVVSCGACGGVTQLWTHEPVELLPWKVIEHWLSVHWDRAGLGEQADEA